jgi:Putative Ig domain
MRAFPTRAGIPVAMNSRSLVLPRTLLAAALAAGLTLTAAPASAASNAPIISGTPPATATVGNPYSFRPSAFDPDGDPIRFEITGKPAWASFDAATGALAGTPASRDVGTYSNIRIKVTDGRRTRSLNPFSITVVQASAALPTTGSATLAWSRPTQNTDGSMLVDLAGYRVHYGQASRRYDRVIELPSPGLTSVVIEALPAGTWYFAVKAYRATGIESDYSGEAAKTIG